MSHEEFVVGSRGSRVGEGTTGEITAPAQGVPAGSEGPECEQEALGRPGRVSSVPFIAIDV